MINFAEGPYSFFAVVVCQSYFYFFLPLLLVFVEWLQAKGAGRGKCGQVSFEKEPKVEKQIATFDMICDFAVRLPVYLFLFGENGRRIGWGGCDTGWRIEKISRIESLDT